MNRLRFVALSTALIILITVVCGCGEKNSKNKGQKKPSGKPGTSATDSEKDASSDNSIIVSDDTESDILPTDENSGDNDDNADSLPTNYRRGVVDIFSKNNSGLWPPTIKNGSNQGGNGNTATDDKWTLYWSDEFDSSILNSSFWNVSTHASGGYLLTNRPKNVCLENGKLVLTALKEDYNNYSYTSASINTFNKFSFKYGRLEFRAKLPYGQGLWPALWTMGENYDSTQDETTWPLCGEIDVMEMLGEGGEAEKNTLKGNKITTCNLHWGENRTLHKESGAKYTLQSGILADDYHIYAIEWDETKIVWYFDDVKLQEVNITEPTMMGAFNQGHNIIINVALNTGFEPKLDNTTPLPQRMYVDYVRIYKPKN